MMENILYLPVTCGEGTTINNFQKKRTVMPTLLFSKTGFRQLLTALLILLHIGAFAQWSWVNSLPQGNTLHDIQFVTATTAFTVGDGGTILKTIDGGYSWNRIATGSLVSLNSVFFLDSLNGYAITGKDYGSLFKTTDGGTTWALSYYFDTFYMYDVWFTDPMHGVCVGEEGVFVTSNGGISWNWNGPYTWNYSVWFLNPSTACMSSEGYLYKSYNGGNTWAIKQSNVAGWRGSLFFMNADTGFHVGSGGQIYRTADAGEHWDTIHSGTTNVLSAAYINPAGTGYIVGYAGTMLKTSDAGLTWAILPPLTTSNLESITFSSATHGVIVGEFGLIMVTEDGGLTWAILSSSVTKKNLKAVFFPDQNTGYITGMEATILKSVNGGNSWQSISIPTNADFSSVFFNDPQTGYVAGTYGTLYKTSDGGGSWNCLVTGVNHDLKCVDFPDFLHGYAIGYRQNVSDTTFLLKTTDGGNTWTVKRMNDIYVSSMVFTSADTGYVVGGLDGKIMKTTDGGTNWALKGNFPNTYFTDLCFPSKNRGFACGANSIYQTNDAGLHWSLLVSGQIYYQHIRFTDPLNGYILGYGGIYGEVSLYRTEDGGNTWWQKPVDLTAYQLNDLFFRDALTGFLVGENGVILKTDNGAGITTGLPPAHSATNYAISIFPNPSNGQFQIQLAGMENSVEVKIFSLMGKEVYSSTYHKVSAVIINFSPLNSGSYMVRIKTDSEVVVKKLVVEY